MKRLAAIVAAFVAIAAHAGNDPHARTYNAACTSCHATHKAAGANLTNAISNESVCTSCHNLGGTAATYPIESFTKADTTHNLGTSHAWNVAADNPALGVQMPLGDALKTHVFDGNVVCSTCHDEHHSDPNAIAAGNAGTQKAATATRIAGSGTGSVTYAAASDATEKGYLLEIIEISGAAGTARFRVSNDGGVSWFGFASGAWTAYATGNAALTGTNVALTDGTKVVATFSGNFAIGDRIRFYVAYPFLRVPLDAGDNTTGSLFCRDCHRAQAMDHHAINTWDGSIKSHPVGITLNANGRGYDRAAPLDASGSPQTGANNPGDLRLAPDQTIQCLTCHSVHDKP